VPRMPTGGTPRKVYSRFGQHNSHRGLTLFFNQPMAGSTAPPCKRAGGVWARPCPGHSQVGLLWPHHVTGRNVSSSYLQFGSMVVCRPQVDARAAAAAARTQSCGPATNSGRRSRHFLGSTAPPWTLAGLKASPCSWPHLLRSFASRGGREAVTSGAVPAGYQDYS
jgi:hypothetical protein